MMSREARQVERRKDTFARRPVTKIWGEEASENNPYIAQRSICQGYDLLELMEKRSFVDVLYLLFRGCLPEKEQAELFESLMIAMISPGPRHAATRAAMNVGVGKTDRAHILPISLSIIGGEFLGAGEVEAAMSFLRKEMKNNPAEVARTAADESQRPAEGDWHPIPGFGSRFGAVDLMPRNIAHQLANLPGAGRALRWGSQFAAILEKQHMGWLSPGVAAAALTDLGFHSRTGAGLFQLLSAPGLLAHGLELSNKPITAMPFLPDEDYIIERDEE